MTEPCLCGDTGCPSCGRAQHTWCWECHLPYELCEHDKEEEDEQA